MESIVGDEDSVDASKLPLRRARGAKDPRGEVALVIEHLETVVVSVGLSGTP